ncbi:maker607 [Drosophila busckii]|uniref:trypsin n=1 Tax=Drosophila busckii TaxID=30019 RepID=A0A0M5IX01_DROBS|nr:maker607 [Drosophila busckii]
MISASGQSESSAHLDGRIINGAEIEIEDAPYQVALLRNGFHICGGSIYNVKIVITAAHCLFDNSNAIPAQNLSVRAGATYHNTGGQVVKVAKIIYYEDFGKYNLSNDIAVLHLSSALQTSDSVKAIPLARKSPRVGTVAFVSGWGRTEHGKYSEKLRIVDLKVVPRKRCIQKYYPIISHKFKIVCAYSSKKDSCVNDSGGPLASKNELIGIVSGGKNYPCASEGYPGFYTDVAKYYEWLMAAISQP